MSNPLVVGMKVAVPSLGLIGTVAKIDPRCVNGAPCPCCKRGVSVVQNGTATSHGVAPGDCIHVVPGALFLSPGCDDEPPVTQFFPSNGGSA
jgi:hypothetical protein